MENSVQWQERKSAAYRMCNMFIVSEHLCYLWDTESEYCVHFPKGKISRHPSISHRLY